LTALEASATKGSFGKCQGKEKKKKTKETVRKEKYFSGNGAFFGEYLGFQGWGMTRGGRRAGGLSEGGGEGIFLSFEGGFFAGDTFAFNWGK